MNFSLFRSHPRALAAAGLILLGASSVSAQQPGRGGQAPQGGRGGAAGGGQAGGGGGGGGGTASANRQYQNTTMVGDATITSDVDTRRLIVVTDDATNENIRLIIANLDKPKPQVLINVVFLQVTHDNVLDFGAEANYTGANVPLNSTHTGGVNVAYADGSVRFLSDSTPLSVLAQLATRDDGTVIPSY